MKSWLLNGFLAMAAFVGAAWLAKPALVEAQGKPKFRITLHTTATGFAAECLEGCAWATQSYSCGSNATACDAQLRESGVGPVR